MALQKPEMTIVKKGDRLNIGYNGEEIVFERVPKNGKKRSAESDALMFVELMKYWTTLTDVAKQEIFDTYRKLNELRVESPTAIRRKIPGLVKILAKHHTLEGFKKIYPPEKIWVPEKLEHSLDNLSPNYSSGMTYVISDYHNLVWEAMLIKPFIPVFIGMNGYLVGKNISSQDRRDNMYSYIDCFSAVASTDIGKSPAIEKLKSFLGEGVEKAKKKMRSPDAGDIDPTFISAYSGFGTDMLEEYKLSFIIVDVLALSPVCAEKQNVITDNENLITTMYNALGQDFIRKLMSSIGDTTLRLKPNPSDYMPNGDENKLSVVDGVESGKAVPIKEAIRSGVYFTNYRQVMKNIGLERPCSEVKTLIDSCLHKRSGGFRQLHIWLVSAVLHQQAHRKTYEDMEPDDFCHAVGIAQMIYINMGFYDIAQLLSCEAIPGNEMGHYIEPLLPEMKKDVDIFYPQRYKTYRGVELQKPVVVSLEALVSRCISPYSFRLKCSEEAAVLLRCEPKVADFRPASNILSQLAEMLVISARQSERRSLDLNEKLGVKL